MSEVHELACSCPVNCITLIGTFIPMLKKNLAGSGGGGGGGVAPSDLSLDPPLMKV